MADHCSGGAGSTALPKAKAKAKSTKDSNNGFYSILAHPTLKQLRVEDFELGFRVYGGGFRV